MRTILRWIGRMVLFFFITSILWVLTLKFVNPPFTLLMVQRGVEEWKETKKWPQIRHAWVNYENLSDNLKRAAIASEDAHFMSHNGFDLNAIKEAYEGNKSGKRLRGGSTISQQTAKNIFLWSQRSWLRKGLETYFTVLIELIWGKKRIMEVYLNMIETGKGIFGAEASARHSFGKSAEKLTRQQAALMIAVLPNPRRWSPGNPTNYIRGRASSIMRYMDHYEIP